MIKIVALPLIILASSVRFTLAQDWQDSYPRISFSSLIEQCESIMGEEALTCETTCFNYCGKLDMKYEVEFTYIGATSTLKGTKKRYIENWLKTYFGEKYNECVCVCV